MTPIRIQRKRTKGWKMPPNTIYVGRPTLYGNPWQGPDAVVAYRRFVEQMVRGAVSVRAIMKGLDLRLVFERPLREWKRLRYFILLQRGKRFSDVSYMCWCPLDEPCHADVWVELANGNFRGVK